MTIDIDDPYWLGLAAYEDARDRRDFKRLVERLRGDEELGRHERDFLADYLEGKVPPRKKKRPVDQDLPGRRDRVKAAYEWLTEVDDWKPDAAKMRCKELFGVCESTVENYKKEPYSAEDLVYRGLAKRVLSGDLSEEEVSMFQRLIFGSTLKR